MSQTLTQAIKEDHEEMYEYFDKYKAALNSTPPESDKAERWCRQFIWEIARHAVGEELVVYPLMESHLGQKGKELADHDREEHIDVKKHLTALDSLISEGRLSSTEFREKMQETYDHLKHHNDDEERDDLPMLEPKLGEEASKEAAKKFSRTKMFSPTRGHPSLPNQPPLEFASFLVTPVDMLRDMFAKFPTEEMKKEE